MAANSRLAGPAQAPDRALRLASALEAALQTPPERTPAVPTSFSDIPQVKRRLTTWSPEPAEAPEAAAALPPRSQRPSNKASVTATTATTTVPAATAVTAATAAVPGMFDFPLEDPEQDEASKGEHAKPKRKRAVRRAKTTTDHDAPAAESQPMAVDKDAGPAPKKRATKSAVAGEPDKTLALFLALAPDALSHPQHASHVPTWCA